MKIESGVWYEVDGRGEVHVGTICENYEEYDTDSGPEKQQSVVVKTVKETDEYGSVPPVSSIPLNEFVENATKLDPQPPEVHVASDRLASESTREDGR